MRLGWAVAILLFVYSGASAQDPAVLSFGNEVRSDVAALQSRVTLAEWRRGHADDSISLAGYEREFDFLYTDFSRLQGRCAFAKRAEQVLLFSAPAGNGGTVPAAPSIDECSLSEAWIETRANVPAEALTRLLAAAWGAPNGVSADFEKSVTMLYHRRDAIGWHRDGWNVWIVPDHLQGGARMAVYARREMPVETDWYQAVGDFGSEAARQYRDELGRIAGLDARAMSCSGETAEVVTGRLERWMSQANGLPAPRRAAALLVADVYVRCVNGLMADSVKARLERLGAKFDGGCPNDPVYDGSWRKMAEELDKTGRAGQIAALEDFWNICLIADGDPLERGERLARSFPEWRGRIRFALAIAHGAALSRDYPGGNPEEGLYGPPAKVAEAVTERERAAAIDDYLAVLGERTGDGMAGFAWMEVWRLRAGLKPARVPFGCSCE